MQIKLYPLSNFHQLRNFYRSVIKQKFRFYFLVLMVLMSCKDGKTSEKVIEPDKMVKVLVDMHLADAVLSRISNQDTMLMMASSKYHYIFKKYGIDSAKFTQSLKYYNYQPKEFTKIYTAVVDTLTARIPKDIPLKKKAISKTKKPFPGKK